MPAEKSYSDSVGDAFEFFASASNVDLTVRVGKPQRAARRIVALTGGNWTLLKDAEGNDSPPGAVFQGFDHLAHTAAITSSAAIMVYW
jgi:hypothetical protein